MAAKTVDVFHGAVLPNFELRLPLGPGVFLVGANMSMSFMEEKGGEEFDLDFTSESLTSLLAGPSAGYSFPVATAENGGVHVGGRVGFGWGYEDLIVADEEVGADEGNYLQLGGFVSADYLPVKHLGVEAETGLSYFTWSADGNVSDGTMQSVCFYVALSGVVSF